MATNFYYVYSLKDPRFNPAKIFYIGKGTGSRAYDHLVNPDNTKKYSLIKEILEAGCDPIVEILVDDISNNQALKIEAELIAAFGTQETGGILTNAIVPKGLVSNQNDIKVPQGAVEKAQLGLQLIKDSILKLLRENPQGMSSSVIAATLGLRSDYLGRQKDYLSYSVIGLLMRDGKVLREKNANGKVKHFFSGH